VTTILLIETATTACSVGLAQDGKLIALRESLDQRSHAELITIFITEVLEEAHIPFSALDAVAVSKGPGSYTGLRIGVSTAKGLCYAHDKPLIAVETLYAMAAGFRQKFKADIQSGALLCPMIDARRMEVYASVFDHQLNTVIPTEAVIVDAQSFEPLLKEQRIHFFGDGAAKCRETLSHQANARFTDDIYPSAAFFVEAAFDAYATQSFEDVAYFEPFYLKDFVAGVPRVKGLR
jgi:tRNA threonylcarbamoyladenosine biosynthesis protein TsaB